MKASELIKTLNANATRTPDEIVKSLSNPFNNWILGKNITLEEYERYRDLPVVLLYFAFHNQPRRIDTSRSPLSNWLYHDHWQEWLGNDYYVRSRESYDANPTEVVDLDAECCRR